MSLQFWKLEVRDHGASQIRFLVRTIPGIFETVFLLYPHIGVGVGGRKKQALWSLPLRRVTHCGDPILITSSKPNYFSKAPPPNTITLGVRVSTHEFEGEKNIQSIAEVKWSSSVTEKLNYLECGEVQIYLHYALRSHEYILKYLSVLVNEEWAF